MTTEECCDGSSATGRLGAEAGDHNAKDALSDFGGMLLALSAQRVEWQSAQSVSDPLDQVDDHGRSERIADHPATTTDRPMHPTYPAPAGEPASRRAGRRIRRGGRRSA